MNSIKATSVKKPRNSNLELYRIICMLMIVAHHYVVNSGLTSKGGALLTDYSSNNSIFLSLFGAWGKTGINCFLMITGYFMCTSNITIKKFLKLVGQIYVYKWLVFIVFFLAGYETISIKNVIQLFLPEWGLKRFIFCFLVFWLTIPFLNILIKNMTKSQHFFLLILMLICYTGLGSIPSFQISINYITWFGIIYLLASFIRLYPCPVFERKHLWRGGTLLSIILAVVSIYVLRKIFGARIGMGYDFVSDSNKIFAIAIAFCSFLWFKNMNMNYSKFINTLGASTFGVLLIHANSDAMRTWLWKDTVDVIGHYCLSTGSLMLYSTAVVITIFIVCSFIDQLRIATLEKWFFNWYDNVLAVKVDTWINKKL